MSLDWRIRIPQRHYSGFAQLLALSVEQFEGLQTALSNMPAPFSIGGFVSRVSSQTDLVADEASAVVDVLVSLYQVRADTGLPITDFVEVLRRALKDVRDTRLPSADENWEMIAPRLQAILNIEDPFGLIAKAVALRAEHGHTFQGAHIVTDLRPVFRDKPQDGPAAAMILHTLRISHFEGNDRKEFFVALDSLDLAELRALLDRADLKAKGLEALLESAHVPLFREDSE